VKSTSSPTPPRGSPGRIPGALPTGRPHRGPGDVTNLPAARNTINIYTVSGDLVQTLTHDGPPDRPHQLEFMSRNGQEIVSGVYLYTVMADDDGFTTTWGSSWSSGSGNLFGAGLCQLRRGRIGGFMNASRC